MHRTAKSLELVEVEVYGCFILCPYLFLHKTLIISHFYKLQINDEIQLTFNHKYYKIQSIAYKPIKRDRKVEINVTS